MPRRYVEIQQDVDVEVNLYDIIDDIVELYYSDNDFRQKINAGRGQSIMNEREVIDILKVVRKDPIMWDRVKPDLEEMMKENYVVVL